MPAIGNIDEIVAAIGYRAFETLVEVRGGETFRVPKHPTPMILQWLGEIAAESFCEAFGGFTIQVPNRKGVDYYPRTRPLLLLGTLSANEIARAVGCTEWTVRQHRKRLRAEGLTVEPTGSKQAASR